MPPSGGLLEAARSAGGASLAANQSLEWNKISPARWTHLENVEISMKIPNGCCVQNVFILADGLREVIFSNNNENVLIAFPEMDAIRVLLVIFCQQQQLQLSSIISKSEHKPPLYEQQKKNSKGQRFFVKYIYNNCISNVLGHIEPLLHPQSTIDSQRVIEVGCNIHSTKRIVLQKLKSYMLESSMKSSRESFSLIISLVDIYFALGAFDEAITDIFQTIAPLSVDLQMQVINKIADAYIANGKYYQAINWLEKTISHSSARNQLPVLDNLIKIDRFHLRNYKMAVKHAKLKLDYVTKQQQNIDEARFEIAQLLLSLRLYEDAIQHLLLIEADEIQGVPVSFILGKAYYRTQEYEKAKKQIQKSLVLTNCYADQALYLSAHISFIEEKYSEARETLLKLVRLYPRSRHVKEANKLSDQLAAKNVGKNTD